MKDFLGKQFGPFKGREWLIIGIGGIGLGLLIRRRNKVGAEADPATIVGSAQPAVVSGGTLYNQGAIVSDVMEALKPKFDSIENRLPSANSGGNETSPGAGVNWPKGFDPADWGFGGAGLLGSGRNLPNGITERQTLTGRIIGTIPPPSDPTKATI